MISIPTFKKLNKKYAPWVSSCIHDCSCLCLQENTPLSNLNNTEETLISQNRLQSHRFTHGIWYYRGKFFSFHKTPLWPSFTMSHRAGPVLTRTLTHPGWPIFCVRRTYFFNTGYRVPIFLVPIFHYRRGDVNTGHSLFSVTTSNIWT